MYGTMSRSKPRKPNRLSTSARPSVNRDSIATGTKAGTPVRPGPVGMYKARKASKGAGRAR